MAQNLGYLFAAFAVTWAALFIYLFYIQRLLADTRRRMKALERDPLAGHSEERGAPAAGD